MTVNPAGRPAAAARPARLRVGVVGAGRAGSALAAAFARAGHEVVAATTSSRTFPLLPDVPRLPADEVAASCSLLVITVPDDTLPGLVRGLAVTGAISPGQFVLHASGRYGLDVLAPAAVAGALPIALHPAMTFTGQDTDLERIDGVAIAVTAANELRIVGEALAVELGGEPVFIPESVRPLWHAALTHGANHLVTLVGQATDLLTAAGVDDPARVLTPLLSAALEGALRHGDAALTGPVSRGDAATISAHVEVLADSPVLPAYAAMVRATAERAADTGRIGAAARDAVLAALADA
jgi:predicted short-subunit dehydrogenase-like oxidoreductase (DUF2520 family)